MTGGKYLILILHWLSDGIGLEFLFLSYLSLQLTLYHLHFRGVSNMQKSNSQNKTSKMCHDQTEHRVWNN